MAGLDWKITTLPLIARLCCALVGFGLKSSLKRLHKLLGHLAIRNI
jgi:hypothetical protein